MRRTRNENPFARGWIALALGFLAAALAGVYDRQLKAPPHAGFLPADANVVIATRDLPTCWDAFEALPAGKALDDGLRVFRQDFDRDLRLLTGIRPTPARWSTWLGRQTLIAKYGDAWGLCVRPGFLLRIAGFLHNGRSETGEYNGIHYRWREGFLLASNSRDWVSSAGEADPYERSMPKSLNTVDLRWTGGELSCAFEAGLPISIFIESNVRETGDARKQQLPLIPLHPTPPMAALSVKDVTLLESIVRHLDESLAASSAWATGTTAIESRTDKWGLRWQNMAKRLRNGGPMLWALDDFDTALPWPVPEGLYLQAREPDSVASHPFDEILLNAESLPGRWSGVAGRQTPLLGPALVLCTASSPAYWYATSREQSMQPLLDQDISESSTAADALLRLHWPRIGQRAPSLIRSAAKLHLLPESVNAALEQKWIPLLNGLEKLGHLELQLQRSEAAWTIEGQLNAPTGTVE